MKDGCKTKKQLMNEFVESHQRIVELEAAQAERKSCRSRTTSYTSQSEDSRRSSGGNGAPKACIHLVLERGQIK